MTQALAAIGKTRLLNNEQQRLFFRCKIIKSMLNYIQNSNTFPLKIDECSITTASSFEICGLFEGIYAAFKCPAFTKYRLEIAKFFDSVTNLMIKNEELSNLLRKNSKLKLISEDIFFTFAITFGFLTTKNWEYFTFKKEQNFLIRQSSTFILVFWILE